jgi:hypothetical protein
MNRTELLWVAAAVAVAAIALSYWRSSKPTGCGCS